MACGCGSRSPRPTRAPTPLLAEVCREALPGNLPKNAARLPRRLPRRLPGPPQESARDRILDCLRDEPGLTRSALAERVGLTPDGVKYHLKNLKTAGALRRVGSDRAGHWEVLR